MSEPRDPLIFVGTARDDGGVDYELPAKVRTAQVRHRFVGKVVEVEIREFQEQRTQRQSRGFHAMVKPWARERGWAIEALKQFLLKEIFGVLEFVNPLTGEVTSVLAEPHTSKLKVAQFSDLIERTLELAAYDGMVLEAPSEYRIRKEAEAKKAARRELRKTA